MPETQIPQSLSTILNELNTAYQMVYDHIDSLTESAYLEKEGTRWSPAEQLEHLVLSSFPVAGLLGKDTAWFAQFGTPEHKGKDYVELKAFYYQVLNTGVKAPAKFTPETTKIYNRAEQLNSWNSIREKLQQRSADWREDDLDLRAVPHPALGLLNVRQMLFFTIFHTYHHKQFMGV